MPRRRRLTTPAILAGLALGCLVACVRPLPIADVRRQSEILQGKQVTVEGQVVKSVELPLVRDHYYQLDDGSGQIWVQTTQPTPDRGSRVRVTGTVGPGLKVPGVEVGVVIVEARRQ